jgi:penicillin-binding protein 1A
MAIKVFKKLVVLGIGFSILGSLSVFMLYLYIEKDLPQITSVDDYQPSIPSIIYDRHGNKLKEMGSENRAIVDIEDVPRKVINSFLAAEDSNFYHHIGIDPLGIARAFMANLKAGRVVQGGSTISQQVAKSFLISKERSIIRKVKDIFLAYKIEQFLTKDEILFLYLNQVYLGGGYYGIKEAFKGYFGKDLSDVTIAESAMVAGLLVAPSRYSPYSNPKFAYMRQAYVLKRLLADKLITKDEFVAASSESIKYQKRKSNSQVGAYFIEFIRKEVVSRLGEERLLRGGLKIYTTMDIELQMSSEDAVNNGALEIDRRQGFLGPIKNLDTQETRLNFTASTQKKFKENYSNYFVIDNNFNRRLELDNIFESSGDLTTSEEMISLLNQDEFFKAYITEVNDQQGVAFVNLMGIDGFISLEDMVWAKARNLQTKTYWKQPLKKISEVLKEGDVILVKYVADSLNGLKVNSNLKEYLDKKSEPFIQLKLFQKPVVQAASISIDPFSGEVYSMVGGNKFYPGYFNRAVQSKRQPGSALKPFVYALALENGYTNASILYDTPESLSAGVSDFNWKPRNYDGKYMGLITLRRSLELSRNVPTIKLASALGVDTFIKFLSRIGLEGDYNNDLSTSLGSGAVSLENLTLGYSLFVNGGSKNKTKFIISIKDHKGNNYEDTFKDLVAEKPNVLDTDPLGDIIADDLSENDQKENNVFDNKNSYLMRSLLQGVVQNGTGKKAKSIGSFLGGKTGTTSDYIDAWFIGFSSRLVTGIWVGFDDNKTLGWPESGSKAALPIWIDIMKKGLTLYPDEESILPEGMVNVLIDRDSGRLATTRAKSPFFELFIEGTEPGSNNSRVLGKESPKYKTVSDDDFYDLR